MIYLHDDFSYKEININATNESNLFESLIVEIWRKDCSYQKFVVGNIYRCKLLNKFNCRCCCIIWNFNRCSLMETISNNNVTKRIDELENYKLMNEYLLSIAFYRYRDYTKAYTAIINYIYREIAPGLRVGKIVTVSRPESNLDYS